MASLKIGLEIHGYLSTKEKLFCACKATRHAAKQDLKPNSFICPICTGSPGSKPMLPNSEAIKKVLQIALITNCKINEYSKAKNVLVFQRKHYNWPDLPKGYQTTISGPYSTEVGVNGEFEKIRIKEVHLEEDPASWNPEAGTIDYNRSGLPLVEIVTQPDFSSPEQVDMWLKNLILTLSYIKALDKNAGIKADVNVSTSGERVEIKNISSLESIRKSIEYEIERQSKEQATRETRRYDEKTGKTIRMRGKEQAEDYRFIPDPDLPILKIQSAEIENLKRQLPESPAEKLAKLIKKHRVSKRDAEILYKNLEIVEFFEQVSERVDPKFALPWVTIELLRVLNYNKKMLDEVSIDARHFIELLELVKDKKITELKAKQLLNEFIPQSFSPSSKLDKIEVIGKDKIDEICHQVIKNNKKAVSDFREGKQEALNFLVGEVMKQSNRRADFKTAKEKLLKLIE